MSEETTVRPPQDEVAAAAGLVPAGPGPLRRNRAFTLFWTGQSISQVGDQVTLFAMPFVAIEMLHASTFEVGAITAMGWLPALFGAAAGTWIDRRPGKRALMLGADLGRGAVLLSLPVAALVAHVTLVQLFLVTVLVGVISLVFNTAYRAFFAQIVPQESYIAANSRLSLSQSAASFAGPAIGGTLVQALGAPVAVLADAVSFLASAACVWRIRPSSIRAEPQKAAAEPGDSQEPDPEPHSFRRELKQGWEFVVGNPVMRASLAGTTTINFFTFLAGTGLLVVFAKRTLGLSPAALGSAFAIGASGSVLGALLAGRIAARLGVGRTIVLGAVLFPAPFAVTASAHGSTVLRVCTLATAEALIGMGVTIFDVNQNAILTAAVPDGMRSRVAGVYSSINYGVRPVAALLGGALATRIGLRATFVIAAVGGSLSLVWFLTSPIPRIKTLDMIDGLLSPDGAGDPGLVSPVGGPESAL